MAHRAEGVNPSVADKRRGTRSIGIGNLVGAIVLMFPQEFASLLVEAENAFLARNWRIAEGIVRIFHAFGEKAIRDINAPVGNDGTGVTGADRRPPADLGAVCGKFIEDIVFAPDGIALRSEPLRPIISTNGSGQNQQKSRKQVGFEA